MKRSRNQISVLVGNYLFKLDGSELGVNGDTLQVLNCLFLILRDSRISLDLG